MGNCPHFGGHIADESCGVREGDFRGYSQNRENGRLRQRASPRENKKSQGGIWHDIRIRRHRPIQCGVFARQLLIHGLPFAQWNTAARKRAC